MKHLFKKQSNKGLISLAVVSTIAAAAVAYLYLTDSGSNTRNKLKKKVKNKAKDLAAGAISKKTGISKRFVKKAADVVVK